jgi:putative endonuclease
MHLFWVYILASRPQGTLYIGVTNSIVKRVMDHRAGIGSKFTRKYKVHMLVWYEEFAEPGEAIQREKNLKHYVRDWKINLIEHGNPQWLDLFPGLPGAALFAPT